MGVVRINEFRSIEGRHEDLRRALSALLAIIRASAGCTSVRLLESENEPEHMVIVEEWRDRDSHRTAAASIEPDAMHRVMVLLAELPTGGYYIERA